MAKFTNFIFMATTVSWFLLSVWFYLSGAEPASMLNYIFNILWPIVRFMESREANKEIDNLIKKWKLSVYTQQLYIPPFVEDAYRRGRILLFLFLSFLVPIYLVHLYSDGPHLKFWSDYWVWEVFLFTLWLVYIVKYFCSCEPGNLQREEKTLVTKVSGLN
jgi:hypothetical protein